MTRLNREPRLISNCNGATFIAYKAAGWWYAFIEEVNTPIQIAETLEGLKLKLRHYSRSEVIHLSRASNQSFGGSAKTKRPLTQLPAGLSSASERIQWLKDALKAAGFVHLPHLFIQEALSLLEHKGCEAVIHYIEEKRIMNLPQAR